MRPLNESTARIAKSQFSQKYIALGRIVNEWENIVGDKVARKAIPVKIHYRKKRKQTDKPQATLVVDAPSALSTSLHYQKPLFLERLAMIFGEAWIADIQFVDGGSYRGEDISIARSNLKPVCPEKKKDLQDMIAKINDAAIKDKLMQMGMSILQEG